MARPPNYKQEKKRREDERRKRNIEADQRKSAQKAALKTPTPTPGAPKPEGS